MFSDTDFRRLVQDAPVAIGVEVGGSVAYLNAEGLRILGASDPAELLGTPVLSLIHPEERALAAERMAAQHRGAELKGRRRYRFQRVDGTPIAVDITTVPAKFDGQRATQIIFYDVADRLRAHPELAGFSKAVEASDAAIFVTDREGLFTYVNPAFVSLYGFEASELIGERTPRVLKSGLLPRDAYSDLWRDILDGRTVRLELLNRARDGRLVTVDASINPILDDDGGIAGFLAIHRDITEHKRRDEELQLTQNAMDRAADAVFGVDTGGRFRYVNQRACTSLGYSRDELLSMGVPDIDPDFPADAWPAHIEESKARGAMVFTTTHRRKDGDTFPVEISASFLEADEGDFVVATARDLTERKQLTDQLLHAQKMEAVGRLAGGIAHDFNNLLSVVLGYSNLLQEELRPSDPLWEDVEQIRQAAKEGANVTRRLLVFSRRQPGLDEIVDVDRAVSAMERLLGRVIGEDVELRTALCGETWPVLMPAGGLEQIITNLVVNARDAMRSGGTITIETANLDESGAAPPVAGVRPPGRYVHVTVRDTGCGMTPEVVARATEPFFTTKSEGEGTGLGLSTVYGLARGAGGDLTIESHPGHGTACHVLLPAAVEASEPLAAEPTKVQRGRGETVLITEDDPVVRRLAARVLRRAGYRVIEAASPGAAILEFEAHGAVVDLLLTDVVMPVMSGKQLADRLRGTTPGLRVLFMSGYADGKLFDDGGEVLPDLLDKPFAPRELLTAVRAALSQADALDQPL